MISVYPKGMKDYLSMGYTLTPSSCIVHEEAGGRFTATLSQPITDEAGAWRYLEAGAVLRIPTPRVDIPSMELATETRTDTEIITTYEYWTINADGAYIYSEPSNIGMPSGWAAPGERCEYAWGDNGNYVLISSPSGGRGWIEKAKATYSVVQETRPVAGDDTQFVKIGGYQSYRQLFRIKSVQADLVTHEVRVEAEHLSYDLLDCLFTYHDYSQNPTTYANVLTQLINSDTALGGVKGWRVYTNVDHNAIYDADMSHRNPIQLLVDPDDGMVYRQRLRLIRDNHVIYLLQHNKIWRGMSVAFGVNLKGLSYSYDINDYYTGVVPFGVTGDGQVFYLPEGSVNVPWSLRDQFDHDRFKPLQTDVVVPNDESFARMRQLAEAELKDMGKIKLTLTVDFVLLGDTLEHQQYKDLQQVFLYDTVRVTHTPTGFAQEVEVCAYDWDALTGRYTKLKLGDPWDASIQTMPTYQLRRGAVPVNKINSSQLNHFVRSMISSAANLYDGGDEA